MKKCVLLFLLSLIGSGTYAQLAYPGWQWALGASSATDQVSSTAIATDRSGNIYMTGDLGAGTTFDSNTILDAAFGRVYIAKYTASGSLVWVRQYGSDQAHAGSIAVGSDGNIYMSGIFQEDMLLDTFVLRWAGTQQGLFIAKLDDNGSVIWVNAVSGKTRLLSSARGLVVDKDNNVIISGSGAADAKVGNGVLAGNGLFVVKYNNTGGVVWIKRHYAVRANVSAAACDREGAVYLTGNFIDTLILGSKTLINAKQSDMDGFVYKINASGELDWVNTMAGVSSVIYAVDIACNDQLDCYVYGVANGQLEFGGMLSPKADVSSQFIGKFTSLGNASWVQSLEQKTFGNGPAGLSVNMSSGDITIASSTNTDMFIMRLSDKREVQWKATATSPGGLECADICLSGDNILVTGRYRNRVSFSYHDIAANKPFFSVFLAKIADVTGIPVVDKNAAVSRAYPNPFSNELVIEGIDKGASIQLFDVTGREVLSAIPPLQKSRFNTTSLLPGNYILWLTDVKGNSKAISLTKQ